MNVFRTFLLVQLIPILLHAQEAELDGLIARQTAFGQSVPQEKVYVHMDNTCYFQGDTIWFAAYTRQTSTGRPSEVSGVLYVELLNNDGYLVERKLVEMKQGRGNGFFALNNPVQYSGFYELRAYTRWQLNWGEHERKHPSRFGFMFRDKAAERAYFRDYDKLYSRVFPVYDKPLVPGDYTRDMTLRVMQREFKNDPEKRRLQLSLFPEGGNLVAGVENRVAFEATMTDGEQVEGTLSIGKESVKTENRGRGVFAIVPEKGVEREVTFTSASGETVSARLPKAEERGVALRVTQEGDSVLINAKLVGVIPDSLALTIMHEGQTVERLSLNHPIRTLGSNGWSPGVYQTTVFDARGRVYADRLFFVVNPGLSVPTLAIACEKEVVAPFEKVDVRVAGEDKGTLFSLAVRDNYQSDPLFDNGNIMTEMLLSSEVKGFIPDPGWFFEKDDAEHRRALDLLMLTQGWRRFVWRDMAVKGAWNLTQPGEKAPILVGSVSFNPNRVSWDGITDLKDNRGEIVVRDYRYALELARKKMPPSLLVHSELVHAYTNETAIGESPYSGDFFKMPLPKFHGSSVLFLSAADTARWEKEKRGYPWIQMAGDGEGYSLRMRRTLHLDEADFRAYISWPYPRFVKPYSFYQTHLPTISAASGRDIPSALLADTTSLLREVTVKARRRSRLKRLSHAHPAFMVDAYEAWNTIEDAGVPIFDYKAIEKALVRVYLNDYGVNEEHDGNGDDRIYAGLQRRRQSDGVDIPLDSLYHPKYLRSVATDVTTGRVANHTSQDFDASISAKGGGSGEASSVGLTEMPNDGSADNAYDEFRDYFGGERVEDPRFLIDKYVVYTDYQPRLEGSIRYLGANRPETYIMVYPFYDDSRRAIYRDRCYSLEGFSYPAEFYHPDYSRQTPPDLADYRRTLYWNPNLQLDGNGEARISFYNNSQRTRLCIEAEGQSSDGRLLWGNH
ncbi:MAG: hypothetical protein HUK03_07415 [Bacteroidaceae bacterium]|nr:hypothetical protein [Bacteroidaceae bacterium]